MQKTSFLLWAHSQHVKGSPACLLLIRSDNQQGLITQTTQSSTPNTVNCGGVKKEVRAEDMFTELLPFSGTQRPWPELLSHALSITVWAGGQRGSLPCTAVPFNSLSWRQQMGLDQYGGFFCTCYHSHKGFMFCTRPVDHLAWFKKKMAQL